MILAGGEIAPDTAQDFAPLPGLGTEEIVTATTVATGSGDQIDRLLSALAVMGELQFYLPVVGINQVNGQVDRGDAFAAPTPRPQAGTTGAWLHKTEPPDPLQFEPTGITDSAAIAGTIASAGIAAHAWGLSRFCEIVWIAGLFNVDCPTHSSLSRMVKRNE